MTKHVSELLPFYAAETLLGSQHSLIEIHLKHCSECEMELRQWRTLREAIRLNTSSRVSTLPPLATWITSTSNDSVRPVADQVIVEESAQTLAATHQKEEIKKMSQKIATQAAPRRFLALAAGVVITIIIGMVAVLLIKSGDNSRTDTSAPPAAVATAAVATKTPIANQISLSYPGATKLVYDETAIKKAVGNNFTPEQLKNSTLSVSASNDDYLKVIAYYKQLLTSLGYSLLGSDNSQEGQATIIATKGDKVVSCGVVPYQVLQTTSSPAPFDTLVKQVKPDQTLIYYLSYVGSPSDLEDPATPTPSTTPRH